MGLDTTHNCWHGPYGAFTRFRNELARAAGYTVRPLTLEESMELGIGGDHVEIDWDVFKLKNYFGEWDAPPGDDPLLYLLVHSDCEGVIHPEQGVQIAERLEQLADLVSDEIAPSRGQRMREKTLQFARGLREAAEAGEDVEFH